MDYSVQLRRRFGAPASAGEFPKQTPGVVLAAAQDRSLNVWVQFAVKSAGGTIQDLRYQVFGCPHTVAAADWIAEALKGQPVDMLARIDLQAVTQELGIPRDKFGKLLLIEDALIACAEQIQRQGKQKGID